MNNKAYLINFEVVALFWHPAIFEVSELRITNMGKESNVHKYTLLTRHTCMRIWKYYRCHCDYGGNFWRQNKWIESCAIFCYMCWFEILNKYSIITPNNISGSVQWITNNLLSIGLNCIYFKIMITIWIHMFHNIQQR